MLCACMLKSKANFWHNIWREAGSPTTGVLFQIKKSSKSRYKYEVRRLKRRKEHIRRMKIAEALTHSKNMAEFWRQVRAVTKKSSTSPVPSVDGVHGPSNISTFLVQVTVYS